MKPYLKYLGILRGLKVFLVDGNWIRTNIDIEFTNWDHHFHKKYIPKNQIWVDEGPDNQEIIIFANSAVQEYWLCKSGISFGNAESRTDKEEQEQRNKEVLQDTDPRISIISEFKGVKVFLVNGHLVRNFRDIEYTEGGHSRVYKWIPENQIWIDNAVMEIERKFIVLHELCEFNLMGTGIPYEKAHPEASKIELLARNNPEKLDSLLQTEINKITIKEETMLSFKKFLKEMVWVEKPKFAKNYISDLDKKYDLRNAKKISDFTPEGSENTLHIYENPLSMDVPSHLRKKDYIVFNPVKKKIELILQGRHKKNIFYISGIEKINHASFKAHKFLKHLIQKHNQTLITDNRQSPGAVHMWDNLMKEPDIEVHGYDQKKKKLLRHRNIRVPADIPEKSSRIKYIGDNWVFLGRKAVVHLKKRNIPGKPKANKPKSHGAFRKSLRNKIYRRRSRNVII